MGKNKFEEFLQEDNIEIVQIDWNDRREKFIKKIDEFYMKMNTFLKPYKDKISLKSEKHTINEDYIGSYEVDKKILHIKNKDITFTPIGTNLIGAWGRIDMEGENGIVKFVLVPEKNDTPKIETTVLITDEDKITWQKRKNAIFKKNKEAEKVWKIATPAPNIKYIDINEENFFDALMEVING